MEHVALFTTCVSERFVVCPTESAAASSFSGNKDQVVVLCRIGGFGDMRHFDLLHVFGKS